MVSWHTRLRQPPSVAWLCLGLATWLVWARPMTTHSTGRATPVPATIGAWVGISIPADQRVIEILETDDVDLLEYRHGAEAPVWLARVAGFGNRAAFHPPELCYIGSHYEVLERGTMTVRVGGAPRRLMRLVLGQDHKRFEAWYWFTANGRVTENYYRQQLWLLLDAMRGRPLAGTLVRISTPLDDAGRSRERLLTFAQALAAPAP
ncbi:MAG: EpsI family protein [Candidatus Omnitrophica bacterium]|nr:EpsI family protein [Candidatus Omnitrophota bacterium]